MPLVPPVRPGVNPYRFHTYDYAGSAANVPWGLSSAQPERGYWQFYSMVRDLTDLAAVGAARKVPNIALNPAIPGMAQTCGGRQTQVLSFGNAANSPGRPTVVITGGIHAREWIATEIAYLIAEYLIVNYPDPAAVVTPTPRQAQLQNLVDTRNIYIIPMINPDGNDRTVFGGMADARMWRKNLRRLPYDRSAWVNALVSSATPFRNVSPGDSELPLASYDVPNYDPPGFPPGPANYQTNTLYNNKLGVDLNRNMATAAWGYDCAPDYDNGDPREESFFGTGAGTEPESSNVQLVMAAAVGAGGNIDVALDYHSYSRLIIYPSELPTGGPAPAQTLLGGLLQALIVDKTNHCYQLGTAMGLINYEANATVADRAAQVHQARAFTIELDPGPNSALGFKLHYDQIQDVFETNIRGTLAAIAAPTTPVAAQQVYANFMVWPVHGAGNQVP
jgi:Zinc carboxypeptidase